MYIYIDLAARDAGRVVLVSRYRLVPFGNSILFSSHMDLCVPGVKALEPVIPFNLVPAYTGNVAAIWGKGV